jgi:hypothetical protein
VERLLLFSDQVISPPAPVIDPGCRISEPLAKNPAVERGRRRYVQLSASEKRSGSTHALSGVSAFMVL